MELFVIHIMTLTSSSYDLFYEVYGPFQSFIQVTIFLIIEIKNLNESKLAL